MYRYPKTVCVAMTKYRVRIAALEKNFLELYTQFFPIFFFFFGKQLEKLQNNLPGLFTRRNSLSKKF